MTWQEFQAEWLGPEPDIVCRTSGSTGTPKEIRLPKEQVSASARRTLQFFNPDSHSHFHSCLAPDYIGGKMMMVRALECGGSFTWEHPSNRPLSDYTGDPIDLLCVVPSQMRHILQNIDTLPEWRPSAWRKLPRTWPYAASRSLSSPSSHYPVSNSCRMIPAALKSKYPVGNISSPTMW